MQRTFHFFDKERSGSLRAAELQAALAALGMAADWEAARAATRSEGGATSGSDGGIALAEFGSLVFALQVSPMLLGSGSGGLGSGSGLGLGLGLGLG